MRALIAAISLSGVLFGQTENVVNPATSPAWKSALDRLARLQSSAISKGTIIHGQQTPRRVRMAEPQTCAIPLVTITPKVESRMPVLDPQIESRMPVLTPPVCQPTL